MNQKRYAGIASGFLLLCTILGFSASAQSEAKGSGAIIADGIKAYDSSSYKRAIQLFSSVPEGDTNFTVAQYELALSHVADSSFKEAKQILLRVSEHPKAEKRSINLLLASVYDYLGEKEAAINEYRKLAALNPNDHQPLYEIGVVHLRQEHVDSAIYYLQRSLLVNSSHHKSMQLLGSCYAMQGRLTESWICLQTSLLSTSNIETARTAINLLDGLSKQTDAFSEPYNNRKENVSHPLFDEIDAILHSRIILSSDYKIKSDLADEPLAKVTYAVMEKLKFDKNDDNFVMQYFVPLWVQLRDQSMSDAFLLQAFSGYQIPKIEKLVASEKKNMAKVRDIIYPYLGKIAATRTLNFDAREKAPLRYKLLVADGVFYEASFKNLNDFDEGPVKAYRNGVLVAEGFFDKAGEKTGKWHYYYGNGRLKSTETLLNGKNTGTDTSWRENGQLRAVSRYNSEGKAIFTAEYNEFGVLTEDYENQANDVVRNNVYYESGRKSLSILLSKSVYQDGDYDTWWDNGKKKRRLTIKGGKLHNASEEYYETGILRESYNYKEGKLDGLYTGYHPNGKVSYKVNYSDGQQTGLYESWDEDGRPALRLEYRKGKLDGKKVFFDEGREYGFVVYDNGVPVAYEFRDPDGKVVGSGKAPLSSLKLYYSNGNLKSEFPLKDGAIEGKVRHYVWGGLADADIEYVKGIKEGKETHFFHSGKVSYEMVNHEDESNGLYKGYNKNGQLIAEGILEHGEKQGLWTFSNVNGKRNTHGYYAEGEVNGPFFEYNINGELISVDYYFEKGIYRLAQFDTLGNKIEDQYFPKGTGDYVLRNSISKAKWFECKLLNGRFEGPYARYTPDGKKTEEGVYQYGKRNGPVTFYWINGVKSCTGFYKEGKQDGVWEFYNELGEHTSTIPYKEGELDGKRYEYVNGEIQFESNYKEGAREGEQYYYDAHKHIGLVTYFSEGILMGYTYEGSDGKLLPRVDLKSGSGKVIAYYANGKKSAELNYEQSAFNGEQTYYYSNGSVAEQRTANDGAYNGAWKEYHENGKLRVETTYKDDEMEGAYKSYDSDGNLIGSRNYFSGSEHGIEEVADPKTRQMRRIQYRYGHPVKVM